MYHIYIASPYTKGIQSANVKLQMDVTNILMDYKYFPYTPLLIHFQEIVHSRSEQDWINLGLSFLKKCDAIFRFFPKDSKGKIIKSKGADIEEILANDLNIPIFYFNSLEDLKDRLKKSKTQIDQDIQKNINSKYIKIWKSFT